jgi:hypothetical protein
MFSLRLSSRFLTSDLLSFEDEEKAFFMIQVDSLLSTLILTSLRIVFMSQELFGAENTFELNGIFEDLRNSRSLMTAFHSRGEESKRERRENKEERNASEPQEESKCEKAREGNETKEGGEGRREGEEQTPKREERKEEVLDGEKRRIIHPFVITQNIWPLQIAKSDEVLKVSPLLLSLKRSFESFFTSLHPRRSLRWIHSSSIVFADLMTHSSSYHITCSLHQYLALRLLNGRSSWSKVGISPFSENILSSLFLLTGNPSS